MHAWWCDGILSHQIVEVWHIPGQINLVGDSLSCRDEDLLHELDDGSAWSVAPNWETAHSLEYDLFSIEKNSVDLAQPTTRMLCERTSVLGDYQCTAGNHWVIYGSRAQTGCAPCRKLLHRRWQAMKTWRCDPHLHSLMWKMCHNQKLPNLCRKSTQKYTYIRTSSKSNS